MAAVPDAIKDIEEQLTCAVCMSLFKEPKVLKCHHVFCTACLARCVTRNAERKQAVACPTCREHTALPSGEVRDLTSSFHTNKLFDVHARLMANVVSPFQGEATAPQEETCTSHPGKALNIWCENCDALICSLCCSRGQRHCSHKHSLVPAICEQKKKEIILTMGPLEAHKSTIEAALGKLEKKIKKLYDAKDTTAQAIHSTATTLHESVDKEEATALERLAEIVEGQVNELAPYKAELEVSLGHLKNKIQSIEYILEKSSPEELVSQARKINSKASQLVRTFRSSFMSQSQEPSNVGSVKYKYSMDHLDHTLKQCFLLYFSDLCISKCRGFGDGTEKAFVNQESTFTVELLDAEGKPVQMAVGGIRHLMVSAITGDSVSLSRTRWDNRQLTYSYTPTVKGRHTLTYIIEGEHIPGSPFTIAVKPTARDYGAPMNDISISANPSSMAVLGDGRIVVTSLTAKTTEIYSQEGQHLQKHEETGYTAITIKTGLSIFAVDRERAVVELDINSFSTPVLQFSATESFRIRDVAVDATNDIYFLLYHDLTNTGKRYNIEVSSSQAKKSIGFGEHGNRNGQLNSPMSLALEPNSGRLFVADTNNHRIQVFSTKGKYLSKFGKEGASPGCLILPTAVAIHQEKVFVGDVASCVSVFSVKGQYLFNIGATCGVEIVQDIVVDECGVVYVCDTKKAQILLF